MGYNGPMPNERQSVVDTAVATLQHLEGKRIDNLDPATKNGQLIRHHCQEIARVYGAFPLPTEGYWIDKKHYIRGFKLSLDPWRELPVTLNDHLNTGLTWDVVQFETELQPEYEHRTKFSVDDPVFHVLRVIDPEWTTGGLVFVGNDAMIGNPDRFGGPGIYYLEYHPCYNTKPYIPPSSYVMSDTDKKAVQDSINRFTHKYAIINPEHQFQTTLNGGEHHE
jgi:hypothetical protein